MERMWGFPIAYIYRPEQEWDFSAAGRAATPACSVSSLRRRLEEQQVHIWMERCIQFEPLMATSHAGVSEVKRQLAPC